MKRLNDNQIQRAVMALVSYFAADVESEEFDDADQECRATTWLIMRELEASEEEHTFPSQVGGAETPDEQPTNLISRSEAIKKSHELLKRAEESRKPVDQPSEPSDDDVEEMAKYLWGVFRSEGAHAHWEGTVAFNRQRMIRTAREAIRLQREAVEESRENFGVVLQIEKDRAARFEHERDTLKAELAAVQARETTAIEGLGRERDEALSYLEHAQSELGDVTAERDAAGWRAERLEKERDEAIVRAEKAEKERDKSVVKVEKRMRRKLEKVVAEKNKKSQEFDEAIERAEKAEKERDEALARAEKAEKKLAAQDPTGDFWRAKKRADKAESDLAKKSEECRCIRRDYNEIVGHIHDISDANPKRER